MAEPFDGSFLSKDGNDGELLNVTIQFPAYENWDFGKTLVLIGSFLMQTPPNFSTVGEVEGMTVTGMQEEGGLLPVSIWQEKATVADVQLWNDAFQNHEEKTKGKTND